MSKNINIHKQLKLRKEQLRQLDGELDKNKNPEQKLITFLQKENFYNTLFLYLKLNYMKHYYNNIANNNNNNNNIEKHLLSRIGNESEKLTFFNIIGLTKFSLTHSLPPQVVYIPPNLIKNYFSQKSLRTIKMDRENANVTNKLDLYFSLLTYIYYHQYSKNHIIQKEIYEKMLKYIQFKPNEKIISSLYESTIYDFSNITDIMADFKYDVEDIKVNGYEFFKCYSKTSDDDNPKYDFKSYDFICHHLITIFRFYEQYILSHFFTDYIPYNDHPLKLVSTCIK